MIEVSRAGAAVRPGRGQLHQSFADLDELALEFDAVAFRQPEVSHDLAVGNLEDVHFEDQLRVSLVLCDHRDLR